MLPPNNQPNTLRCFLTSVDWFSNELRSIESPLIVRPFSSSSPLRFLTVCSCALTLSLRAPIRLFRDLIFSLSELLSDFNRSNAVFRDFKPSSFSLRVVFNASFSWTSASTVLVFSVRETFKLVTCCTKPSISFLRESIVILYSSITLFLSGIFCPKFGGNTPYGLPSPLGGGLPFGGLLLGG